MFYLYQVGGNKRDDEGKCVASTGYVKENLLSLSGDIPEESKRLPEIISSDTLRDPEFSEWNSA